MTRPWRNCRASVALINEINALWPNRDRSSDGSIGDAAHATRQSDHNPWVVVDGIGVVRARDIDKDGIPAADIAEYLRQLGARRDPRLYPNGYVIFNRRITSPDFGSWRTYTGSNPHTSHIHVSFSTSKSGFDSDAPWGLVERFRPQPPPPPRPRPPEDDDMPVIVKCKPDPNSPTIWTGLLSGGVLIGPLSEGEIQSLEDNRKAQPHPVWEQWVERYTWERLKLRSHPV